MRHTLVQAVGDGGAIRGGGLVQAAERAKDVAVVVVGSGEHRVGSQRTGIERFRPRRVARGGERIGLPAEPHRRRQRRSAHSSSQGQACPGHRKHSPTRAADPRRPHLRHYRWHLYRDPPMMALPLRMRAVEGRGGNVAMDTNTLARAVAHHQAGRLAEAERGYRRILAADPRHADALHLLGVLSLQSGRAGEAVELIAKALERAKGVADYWDNLGSALAAAGRPADAVQAHRNAVILDPQGPQGPQRRHNLGNALTALGRHDEAGRRLRRRAGVEAGLCQGLVQSRQQPHRTPQLRRCRHGTRPCRPPDAGHGRGAQQSGRRAGDGRTAGRGDPAAPAGDGASSRGRHRPLQSRCRPAAEGCL